MSLPPKAAIRSDRLGSAALLVFVVAAGALVLENPLLLYLSTVAGITLFLSLAASCCGRVDLTQRLDTEALFAGEELELRLQLQNRTVLPLPCLRVNYRLPPVLRESRGKHGFFCSLGPLQHREWRETIRCPRRGIFEVPPPLLRQSDIFELASVEKEVGSVSSILTVYPRLFSLENLPFTDRQLFGKLKSLLLSNEDNSSLSYLRDYSEGDPQKKVDWKATARRGSLQVRVFDFTSTATVYFVPDLNTAADRGHRDNPSLEEGISWAATLGGRTLELGMATGLFAVGRETVHCPPLKSRSSFYRFLFHLAGLEPAPYLPLSRVLAGGGLPITRGSLLAIITPDRSSALLEQLTVLQKQGYRPLLMPLERPGPQRGKQSCEKYAAALEGCGIPVFPLKRTQTIREGEGGNKCGEPLPPGRFPREARLL